MIAGSKPTNIVAKGGLPHIEMYAPRVKFVLGIVLGICLAVVICAALAYVGNYLADWIASGEAEMTAEEKPYFDAIQLALREGWLLAALSLASALAHDVYSGIVRYPVSLVEKILELIPRAIFLITVIVSEIIYLQFAMMCYEGDQIVGCVLFVVMGIFLAINLASAISRHRSSLDGHPFTEALVLLLLGSVSLVSLLLFLFVAFLVIGSFVLMLLISVALSSMRAAM